MTNRSRISSSRCWLPINFLFLLGFSHLLIRLLGSWCWLLYRFLHTLLLHRLTHLWLLAHLLVSGLRRTRQRWQDILTRHCRFRLKHHLVVDLQDLAGVMRALGCLKIDQIHLKQFRGLFLDAHFLKDLEDGASCEVHMAVIEPGLNLCPLLVVLKYYLQSVFLGDH